VGEQDFAVLRPEGSDSEVTILKVVSDEKGQPAGFEDPTDKEFEKAVELLQSRCDCGCEGGDECCGDSKEPAAKASKGKASKGKAKVAAKKSAKKSAAKKATAKAPVKAPKRAAAKAAKKAPKRAAKSAKPKKKAASSR